MDVSLDGEWRLMTIRVCLCVCGVSEGVLMGSTDL